MPNPQQYFDQSLFNLFQAIVHDLDHHIFNFEAFAVPDNGDSYPSKITLLIGLPRLKPEDIRAEDRGKGEYVCYPCIAEVDFDTDTGKVAKVRAVNDPNVFDDLDDVFYTLSMKFALIFRIEYVDDILRTFKYLNEPDRGNYKLLPHALYELNLTH